MTSALKYWNGSAWVTVASVNLMTTGGGLTIDKNFAGWIDFDEIEITWLTLEEEE